MNYSPEVRNQLRRDIHFFSPGLNKMQLSTGKRNTKSNEKNHKVRLTQTFFSKAFRPRDRGTEEWDDTRTLFYSVFSSSDLFSGVLTKEDTFLYTRFPRAVSVSFSSEKGEIVKKCEWLILVTGRKGDTLSPLHGGGQRELFSTGGGGGTWSPLEEVASFESMWRRSTWNGVGVGAASFRSEEGSSRTLRKERSPRPKGGGEGEAAGRGRGTGAKIVPGCEDDKSEEKRVACLQSIHERHGRSPRPRGWPNTKAGQSIPKEGRKERRQLERGGGRHQRKEEKKANTEKGPARQHFLVSTARNEDQEERKERENLDRGRRDGTEKKAVRAALKGRHGGAGGQEKALFLLFLAGKKARGDLVFSLAEWTDKYESRIGRRKERKKERRTKMRRKKRGKRRTL